MSRILRRPMFRGGRVSSYGTGIAAPLVPGYQSGGQIGGGIIYGKPMADGRYGFQSPFLREMILGKELGHLDAPKFIPTTQQSTLDLTGKIDEVYQEPHIEPEIASYDKKIETDEKSSFDKLMEDNQWGDQDRTKTDEVTIEDKIEAYKKDGDTIKDIIEFTEQANVYIDSEGRKRNASTGKLITRDKKDIDLETVAREIPDVKDILNPNLENIETKPELTAKEMVAENKSLFADLLGKDKAWKQDAADMLMGASAKFLKPGATVRSGLGEFMEAESQRPGRRQKIEDSAAGLAIQDYIAGKRSKEQIEALKGKIDYEYDKKLTLSIPQESDSYEIASFKLNAADIKPNSDKAIKALIGLKKKTDKVFRIEGIKMKDLDKPKKLKKLKIGYNIIEEDGIKNIVFYDGTPNIKIQSISEIWSQG